jgi:hypothetical protein
MNRISLSFWLFSALALGGSNQVLSEDLPSNQPKLLTIVREEVKVGRNAEHAKHEAGWPAAYEKAKSTDCYLAMTSLTGPNEAWYVIPWESHAAIAASMKRDDKNPVLSAELDRLSLADRMSAAIQETVYALTAEKQAARQKFQTEGVISSEMNYFKLDPIQSYVSKETRAKDPEFWSLK